MYRKPGSRINADWFILAAYALLTLVMTWPVVTHLGDQLAGNSADSLQNTWNIWWVERALIQSLENPFYSHAIYFPDGVSLLFHTLNITNGILAIPFQLAFGDVIASNLIILASVALTGYAEYLLARKIVRMRAAAFIAGVILTFSPYHMAHVWGGQMQLVSLQWLPFFLLFFLQALYKPSLRWAVLAGMSLGLVALTDWYYFLFAGLAAAVLMIGMLVQHGLDRLRAIWKPGLIAVALFLALVSPIVIPMLREAASNSYMYPSTDEAVKFSADTTALFLPSQMNSLLGPSLHRWTKGYTGGPYESAVYLGLTPMALMGLGLRRNWRKSWPWLAVAMAATLLALGPVLHVFGRYQFGINRVEIPLPYAFLGQLPLLSLGRSVSRFVAVTMIALGVLAAFGVREWAGGAAPFKGIRQVWPYVVSGLVLILVGGEFLAVPVPMESARIPGFAQKLALVEVSGVLDLPIGSYVLDAYYMLYQTEHGKPMVGGYVSRLNPHPLVEALPAWQAFAAQQPSQADILIEPAGVSQAQMLTALGVSHVIIHKTWWPDYESDPNYRTILKAFPLIYQDEEELVYALTPQPAPLVLSLNGNWYPAELMEGTEQPYRWIKDEAEVVLLASHPQKLTLSFALWAFQSPRHLELLLNGSTVERMLAPTDTIRQVTTKELELKSGLNRLQLRSVEPPIAGQELAISQDPRPLSIAITAVSANIQAPQTKNEH